MNIIKILPFHEAQKIAAGEVVERPANVVKELLENALDADATQITLSIKKSGKDLIRVVDNGKGMTPDDAKLCVRPHATSKISKLEDLETISTFGFRGEALASIAAISKLEIITKQKDAPGAHISFQEGKVSEEKTVQCSQGTEICVRNIFYNTPVRKKFLKQDETEWNQIQTIVHAFCLSNLSIHFKLFRDEKLIVHAPAAQTLTDRVAQIWDHTLAQNLLEIEKEKSDTTKPAITGLISNHHFWRYGKTHIFFFVNNRYVKNIELSKGLLKGFHGILPQKRFPAAFLFITTDQKNIDVNVHPKKEEVRFIKPLVIRNTIEHRVRTTLENALTEAVRGKPVEQSERTVKLPVHPELVEGYERNVTSLPYKPFNLIHVDTEAPIIRHDEKNQKLPTRFLRQAQDERNLSSDHSLPKSFSQKTILPVSNPVRPELVEGNERSKTLFIKDTQKNLSPFSIIGQLFSTYILIERDAKFLMIDQHAAHERILYERMRKNFEHQEGTQLLFPQTITLSSHHMKLILDHQELFSQQGIELIQFGDTQINISSCPPKLQNNSLTEMIHETATFIEEHEKLDTEILRKKLHEHVHSHLACKTAVRAGDNLDQKEMQQIVSDLLQTSNRHMCIHGRPTMWTLEKNFIEKNFRRR